MNSGDIKSWFLYAKDIWESSKEVSKLEDPVVTTEQCCVVDYAYSLLDLQDNLHSYVDLYLSHVAHQRNLQWVHSLLDMLKMLVKDGQIPAK